MYLWAKGAKGLFMMVLVLSTHSCGRCSMQRRTCVLGQVLCKGGISLGIAGMPKKKMDASYRAAAPVNALP